MDNKNVFARNLQRIMDMNGKTRREVCRDLGFSYNTYSDWVTGRKYPRMDKVEMLAQYFGVAKSDFIEETFQPTAANDGLSDSKRELLDFVQTVPDEKAALILQAMKLLLEASE